MPKIIIERGAPGSGKSTCAKERCKKDNNVLRVSRDDLRTMGFGITKWRPRKEDWICDLEESAVKGAIANNFSVIVDSTNLMQSRIDRFSDYAKALNAELVICDHTDVPFNVLVERDSQRNGTARVGRVVIERLLAQAGRLDKTSNKVVICDIDGTVANLSHRLRFISSPNGKERDYHAFFANVDMDTPIQENIDMVREFKASGRDIWMVSGRCDFHVEDGDVVRVGDMTIAWLNHHGVPFDHIFMRRANDRRPDTDVKLEILTKQILPNIIIDQISCVIDDRPSVLRMWVSQGLKVVDVGPGVEF